MRVIKVGGSLEQTGALKSCLQRVVRQNQKKIVIVPGGGGFADQVRRAQQRWGFDDACAHHMAILAMQQMALLFQALTPPLQTASSIAEIRLVLASHANVVWSPDITDLNSAGIEANWDVTSDSLAAWLASELGAEELILIKSTFIPANTSVNELADKGIVDKAFVQFIENAFYKTTIIDQALV